MDSDPTPQAEPSQPPGSEPPGAFIQGVGTVFQFVGVTLFLILFLTCCISAVLTRNVDARDFSTLGWASAGHVVYSAKDALAISLPIGIVLSLAVAALGLGLQAHKPLAPGAAVFVCLLGSIFWLIQTFFFAQLPRFLILALVSVLLGILFIILLVLAILALLRSGQISGAGPSAYTEDDALTGQLELHRRKLAAEQKEIDGLESRLKRKGQGRP